MSKYELTISSNYVRHWGVVEGVREFFQNAIDEEHANPNHIMNWSYDPNAELLTISNKDCKLSINSLLLGSTTKIDGKSIGQFGEGYKVAIVVLLREGKEVTIHNADELWTTRMVKSRRYKDNVPVIETSKFGISGNDLIVEISGITLDEFELIKESNLLIENIDNNEYIETSYGKILLNKPGKIYVSGLYICKQENLKYGYDINSNLITLNRDRNLVSTFDITWNSSKMLCEANENGYIHLFDIMYEDDIKDADYISTFIRKNSKEELYRCFKEKYGDRIPVSTQEEYDYFESKGMKPVFVKSTIYDILSGYYSKDYEERKTEVSLYCKLKELKEKFSQYLPDNLIEEFDNLLFEFEDELKEIETE